MSNIDSEIDKLKQKQYKIYDMALNIKEKRKPSKSPRKKS